MGKVINGSDVCPRFLTYMIKTPRKIAVCTKQTYLGFGFSKSQLRVPGGMGGKERVGSILYPIAGLQAISLKLGALVSGPVRGLYEV